MMLLLLVRPAQHWTCFEFCRYRPFGKINAVGIWRAYLDRFGGILGNSWQWGMGQSWEITKTGTRRAVDLVGAENCGIMYHYEFHTGNGTTWHALR